MIVHISHFLLSIHINWFYFNSQEILEEKATTQTSKEPLCMQKIHRKVLDKGIPPDVMPGIKGVKVKIQFNILMLQ